MNTVWRKFDIRGLTTEDITATFAYQLGLATAQYFRARYLKTVGVGRDLRASSPSLQAALIQGLAEGGMHVFNLGVAPTPAVYFATSGLGLDAGIVVTASHNPAGYNGFKFRLQKRALLQKDFEEIHEYFLEPKIHTKRGTIESFAIKDIYCKTVANQNTLSTPLKIVLDVSNGATSKWAPYLFEKMGAEIVIINCEEDGALLNQPIDSTKTENLLQLQRVVLEQGADLGFIFDGDGDRVGMVTADGNMHWGDQLLTILMQEALQWKKAPIVCDVKSTMALDILAKRFGVTLYRSPTGSPLIQQKMVKHNAILGGEHSSQICHRQGYYSFDDGLFTAAKLASIAQDLNKFINNTPKTIISPEIRKEIQVDEQDRFKQKSSPSYNDCNLDDIDGLRYSNEEGWCLIRLSSMEKKIVVRVEGIDHKAYMFWRMRLIEILGYFDINIDLTLLILY